MKKFFASALFILPLFVSAQSFVFTPSDIVVDTTLGVGTSTFRIYFTNVSTDTITLEWDRSYIEIPDGWDYGLCDWGNCYAGVPPHGTMDPLIPGDSFYYQLHTISSEINGVAMVKLFTWVQDNAAENDTATFIISYGSVSGYNLLVAESGLNVYPNPATDFLMIANNQSKSEIVNLVNVLGEDVQTFSMEANEIKSIDVRDLNHGMYFIEEIKSNGDKLVHKILIR